MKKNPAGVKDGKGGVLLARAKGGEETEEKADREEEDADRDGFVPPVDNEEGDGEKQTEESLGFVGVDRETVVGGVEHLGERDEVEEDGRDGGRDGDVTPAGPIVEGGGQDRKRRYAVEEDRDFEPKQGHRIGSPAAKLANLQYIALGVKSCELGVAYAVEVYRDRRALCLLFLIFSASVVLRAENDPEPLSLLRPAVQKLDQAKETFTRFTFRDLNHTININEKGKKSADETHLYDVTYIGALQYSRLLETDGKPLNDEQLAEERRRYDDAVREHSALDDSARAKILHEVMKNFGGTLSASELSRNYQNAVSGHVATGGCDCVIIDSTPLAGASQRSYRFRVDPAKEEVMEVKITLLADEEDFVKGSTFSLQYTYIDGIALVSHSHIEATVVMKKKRLHVITDHTYSNFRKFSVTSTIVPIAPNGKP